ncbi:MAG: type VI secretion system baseplate subunit TssE [Planctomycetes bacterium]|nr:type VI secretion system baseplate subunit TssE [Planctomycetota bacterium]
MAQRDRLLLDRLRGTGTTGSSSGAFDRHIAYESVRRNIERICGSRRGMAEAQDDYGMPEINFAGLLSEAVDQLRLVITENIQKYEPRLQDVSVLPADVGSNHGPAVLIEGQHIADPDGHYGAFVVIYETPGRVTVSLA